MHFLRADYSTVSHMPCFFSLLNYSRLGYAVLLLAGRTSLKVGDRATLPIFDCQTVLELLFWGGCNSVTFGGCQDPPPPIACPRGVLAPEKQLFPETLKLIAEDSGENNNKISRGPLYSKENAQYLPEFKAA